MIISHHPMIFKAIKKVTDPMYLKLIENKIAVYCAHTNLDTIPGGVNTRLAEVIGLKNLRFLTNETGSEHKYIKIFMPDDNFADVKDKILRTKAEIININKLLSGNVEMEIAADSFSLPQLNRIIYKNIENPRFVVLNSERENPGYGLGVIGDLEKPLSLLDFARRIKKVLSVPGLRCWPGKYDLDKQIKTVALCGGSGTSVLKNAMGNADVFVSGDFTYHTILDCRMPLIDAGHFYTENPVLQVLRIMLAELDVNFEYLLPEEHEISKLIVL